MNILFGDVVVSGDMTIDATVALFTFTIVAFEYTAGSMNIIPKTIFFKLLPSTLKAQYILCRCLHL
jgi:hypothetical protein